MFAPNTGNGCLDGSPSVNLTCILQIWVLFLQGLFDTISPQGLQGSVLTQFEAPGRSIFDFSVQENDLSSLIFSLK